MGRSVQYPFVYLSVVKTQSQKRPNMKKTYRVRHICSTALLDSKIASLQVRDLTDRAHGDRGDMVPLQTVGFFDMKTNVLW